MWPAFNSFVVLLPCGKKRASPRLGEKRRRKGGRGGNVALCIPLFVCSTEEFFFLRAIFDPRNYFLKSDLFFLG